MFCCIFLSESLLYIILNWSIHTSHIQHFEQDLTILWMVNNETRTYYVTPLLKMNPLHLLDQVTFCYPGMMNRAHIKLVWMNMSDTRKCSIWINEFLKNYLPTYHTYISLHADSFAELTCALLTNDRNYWNKVVMHLEHLHFKQNVALQFRHSLQ